MTATLRPAGIVKEALVRRSHFDSVWGTASIPYESARRKSHKTASILGHGAWNSALFALDRRYRVAA